MSTREPRQPDDLHHLAAAYALDALDPDERRRFEAHYGTCDVCAQEVGDFRETAGVLADHAAVTPPTDLKARVMAEVGRTRQLPPTAPSTATDLSERRRRRAWFPAAAAAVAAAVVAVIGTVAVLDRGSGPDEIAALLAAPDAVVTTLDGDAGTIRLVWSPSRDEVGVVGERLPLTEPGRTYALWFLLDDGSAAPAGLFRPDDDGTLRRLLTVEDVDSAGFGVTIEPDGGSAQPTGPVLYVGDV